jgi:hypothetical protein
MHLGLLYQALYTSVAFQSDRWADSTVVHIVIRHTRLLVTSQNLAALVPS